MWKDMVEPDGPQMTICRMRFACGITKATGTHWEYEILIILPRQQWLRERAPQGHVSTYIACLVCSYIKVTVIRNCFIYVVIVVRRGFVREHACSFSQGYDAL